MPPWRAGTDHLRIAVRLKPGASADRIEGLARLSDGSEVVSARVRAVAESGRANAALERLVADAFGLSRSAVTVVAGHKARQKQLRVDGDPNALADIAARLWPAVAAETEEKRLDKERGGGT